jgi:hypothetical protein
MKYDGISVSIVWVLNLFIAFLSAWKKIGTVLISLPVYKLFLEPKNACSYFALNLYFVAFCPKGRKGDFNDCLLKSSSEISYAIKV